VNSGRAFISPFGRSSPLDRFRSDEGMDVARAQALLRRVPWDKPRMTPTR
jgi:hypothetical protein